MASSGVLGRVASLPSRVSRPLVSLLRRSPRELSLVYLLKALDSYGYFALSEVFTLYLSDEFGVDDVTAGTYYGLWGTAITVYGVLTGFLVDALGVRRSLACSYALQFASRVALAWTRDVRIVLAVVFLVQPLGSAWGAPVMTIAIKRLTRPPDRTLGFGVFYAMMNVAALVSGVAIDAIRLGLPSGLPGASEGRGDAMARPVRVVVASTAVTSLLAGAVAWHFREPPSGTNEDEDEAEDSEETFPARGPSAASAPKRDISRDVSGDDVGDGSAPLSLGSEARRSSSSSSSSSSVSSLLRSRTFWQFLAMALFTLNLKQIFRHMDATFPKYAVRAFGCSAPFGSIYAINPALIIVGVPIVAALTPRTRHFDMIFRGSWITALAPFVVAYSQTYAGAIGFVVLLSLGEMVWSPRWYDYTMACAPAGREGVFGAMALMPLFFAKLPVGVLGGVLLRRYCPGRGGEEGDCPSGGGEEGTRGEVPAAPAPPCDGRSMWAVVGLVTLASPVLILIFHPWLRDSGEDAYTRRGGGGDGGGKYERLGDLAFEGGGGGGGAGGGGVELAERRPLRLKEDPEFGDSDEGDPDREGGEGRGARGRRRSASPPRTDRVPPWTYRGESEPPRTFGAADDA